MRVAFSDTIVFDKFLISPKLYMFIFCYSTSSIDISKLIIYYTDGHEVDEDTMTVMNQGGDWPTGSWVGITVRHIHDHSYSTMHPGVVSKNK